MLIAIGVESVVGNFPAVVNRLPFRQARDLPPEIRVFKFSNQQLNPPRTGTHAQSQTGVSAADRASHRVGTGEYKVECTREMRARPRRYGHENLVAKN